MRGVSELVGTILLIVLTVAAAVVLAAWLSTYVEEATKEVPLSPAPITIEEVEKKDGKYIVVVRNIATSDVTIAVAWIEGTDCVEELWEEAGPGETVRVVVRCGEEGEYVVVYAPPWFARAPLR